MKRFDNVKMVLFDSTNAYFKLAVEAQFTRKAPDGSYRDLVYTTDRGTSILNPNIYLTLSYKDDNMNAVYTSYPQLYLIRSAFEKIKNMLLDDHAFILDPNDNSLSVKQTYADAVVVSNIGKNNNWISLKLDAIKTGENGVFNYSKGVTLELSTSNGWSSQLSQEEFLTVYTIIKDLNLSNLQCMMSLAFLNCDARPMNMGYTQQNAYYNAAPAYAPAPQQNQAYAPQGNWSAPQAQPQQTTYMKPRYNGQQRTPSYRTPAPAPAAPQAPSYSTQQTTPVYDTPVTAYATHTVDNQPQPSTLPPRGNKPLMNMNAVEETPVSSYDIDDSEALDAIFNN